MPFFSICDHWKVFFCFGSSLLCSSDSPYVTHQVLGASRRNIKWTGTNQTWPNYENHTSPISPPLWGGISMGQAIPAYFRCAPHYCFKMHDWKMWEGVAIRPEVTGGEVLRKTCNPGGGGWERGIFLAGVELMEWQGRGEIRRQWWYSKLK